MDPVRAERIGLPQRSADLYRSMAEGEAQLMVKSVADKDGWITCMVKVAPALPPSDFRDEIPEILKIEALVEIML